MNAPAPRTVSLPEAKAWLRAKTAAAPPGTPPLEIIEYGADLGPSLTVPGRNMVRAVVAAPDGSEQEYHFWNSSFGGRPLGRWERTLKAAS